jgi:hypothetical protein
MTEQEPRVDMVWATKSDVRGKSSPKAILEFFN